jgi:hypothetical protein
MWCFLYMGPQFEFFCIQRRRRMRSFKFLSQLYDSVFKIYQYTIQITEYPWFPAIVTIPIGSTTFLRWCCVGMNATFRWINRIGNSVPFGKNRKESLVFHYSYRCGRIGRCSNGRHRILHRNSTICCCCCDSPFRILMTTILFTIEITLGRCYSGRIVVGSWWSIIGLAIIAAP